MSRKAPAGTPALRALQSAGVAHTVREYEHDPRSQLSFGMEAAHALGVEPARVFKTLLAEVDGALVVAVVPVTGELDLKALAAAVGGKRAAMAERDAAERATGYVVGGISPLGQRKRLAVVVDVTALDHATVLVSAGRRGADVELAPSDLVALTGATTARIGRS
ncbi:Cys-tRNA(Pro) deacylase [Georgenia sp. H159]|uniref:Cys-tRNA(Pro) deacylase n=1 Tax=Georgenia sp. H159 TaxID=3076115 RepID=UPI002D78DBDD|nr:Cys-tRNA(Pro) deacylase [Georgenia sp. H159]